MESVFFFFLHFCRTLLFRAESMLVLFSILITIEFYNVFHFLTSPQVKNIPFFIVWYSLFAFCKSGSILICLGRHFYLAFFYSVLKAFLANPLILQVSRLELRGIIGFSHDCTVL